MKKKLKDVISKEFKGLWGTDFSDDGIPVIKTNNMTYEGRIDYSDICLRNITSEEAEENFLCNGDLIIEKSGGTKTHSVGYVNIFEGEDNKYVCNNFILPIRPNRDLVNPKYLFWQLHGMYEAGRFSDCFNKTTGIQNLQKKTYFSKEINVPTLPEQQKIAAHLDSIQSAIDNKKQQLQQLDELVKSKFVEMFGENPVESGKWKVEKLSSICKVQTGGTPSRMHPEYFEGNIPWITTANLGVNELNYDDAMEYITQEAVDNSATKIIPAHSLFIGIRVGVGKCSINNVDMCSNQDICGLSGFDVARTNLLFVKKVIDSYEDYFDNAKRGTTIKGVKSDTIKELKIFLPEIELQTTFAEYVQKIDSAKSIIKTQLEDLQELLDSKMDEYFGE